MKKLILTIALILGVLLGASAATALPANAQENPQVKTLDTVLARSAANGLLVSLTRPELTSTMAFYLKDGLQVENLMADIGQVTGYEITSEVWLVPGMLYEVRAKLQPGGQTLIIHTSKTNNRWRVEGLAVINAPAAAVIPSTAPASGPSPIAGNGSGTVVFQTQNAGDIYAINANGTGLRYITSNGIDPQLSPDGSQIAFTRWAPNYELYTINADGSNERSWFGSLRQMKSPTWSADGQKIAFNYQNGGRLNTESVRVSLDQFMERIFKGETEGIPNNARDIKTDNDYLEYKIPPNAYWWLAEIDLNEATYVDLATGSRYNYAPTGHPTDPNLVYYRADQGIGVYNRAMQQSMRISTDDKDRGPIAVSPDGTKLAFTYNQDGHWEIHTINVDGSNRQRLTKTPISVIAGLDSTDNQVYVNEEGFRTMSRAQPDSMPNLQWNNASPVWSPDGSQIAFMSDRSGTWQIWIMNADGSNQRPMFSNGAVDDLTFNFAGVDDRMLSWR